MLRTRVDNSKLLKKEAVDTGFPRTNMSVAKIVAEVSELFTFR